MTHSLRVPRRPRVLLVDDDPEILKGLRRVVSAAEPDWDVQIARNGQQALRQFELQRIDVVLTDLQMPVVDGLALLGEVSRSHPETVRVVHTSQSEMKETELMRKLADHVLVKPAITSELLGMLRWAMDAARAVRLAAEAG